MQKNDGMNYAPKASGKKVVVVKPGEFIFSVIGLDHGHIFAMANGLLEAGATLAHVYDDDEAKMQSFVKQYPSASLASSKEEVLSDQSRLIVSAIRPDKRFELGKEVILHGKDYFVDKPGFLKLSQVEEVKKLTQSTGNKYMVYFGERIHVEGAVMAEQMINDGDLGDIVSMQILAPHRLNPATRPPWFWNPGFNGGIIADLGAHQLEQFLFFAHATTATITHSLVGNFRQPDHPQFQDYGEVSLLTNNGIPGFCRVDWFTPDGLGAWGDGRVFVIGTKATLEIRKYIDVANSPNGDQLYLVDALGEHHICAYGATGFPFFGEFILDCINRTEKTLSQGHVLEAMRLTLLAQETAEFIGR